MRSRGENLIMTLTIQNLNEKLRHENTVSEEYRDVEENIYEIETFD